MDGTGSLRPESLCSTSLNWAQLVSSMNRAQSLVSSHPTGAGRHSSNFTGLSSSVSLVEMLGLELRPT